MSTKERARTRFTPPRKGDKTAALYVIGRSRLSSGVKAVFCVLVWHANGTNGRCDPSHESLQWATGLSANSVSDALKKLEAERFIIKIRDARPQRSAAYQINWTLLSEIQTRWEKRYQAAMAERRRAREAEWESRRVSLRTYKSTDILPISNRTSPQKRGGNTPKGLGVKPSAYPPKDLGVNSLELYESNSASDAGTLRDSVLREDAYSVIEEDLRSRTSSKRYELVVKWVSEDVMHAAVLAEMEKPHSGACHILEVFQAQLDLDSAGGDTH